MDTLQTKTEYCLNCKNKPCTTGCPLGNDIPAFIALAKEHKYKEAYEVLRKTTVMPFICGRICPKSKQCQGKCTRGIKGNPVLIGDIESKIGDMAIENGWYRDVEKPESNGRKIAIIGGGPAGITASIFLAREGFDVNLFEKREKIGGLLRYGIPEFRLDKKYIDIVEEYMRKLGINIQTSKSPNLNELKEEYDEVILCCGANLSTKMGIPGENLPHVFGANELLEYGNHPDYIGKKVIVIGGGNVAIDAARVSKHMGAKEVTIAYRRAKPQMPAEQKEVDEAEKEGIKFLFQVNVKEIEVKKLHLVKTKLVKKEGETRLVPVEIPESKFTLDADYVIMAIGSILGKQEINLKLDDKGYINVDENYKTSLPNVYACGDCTGETATVACASRSGREVADRIAKMVTGL